MWRSIFNSILPDFSISRLPTALGCESHGQAGLANNMMQMQQYMPERYPPFKHNCARLQMGLWWGGSLVGGVGGLWGFLVMGLMELVGVGGEGLPEHVSGGLSLILGKWIAQAPHICPPDIVQVFYWFPTLCPSMKPWLEGGSVKTEVRPLSDISTKYWFHTTLPLKPPPARHNCKALLSSQLLCLLQSTCRFYLPWKLFIVVKLLRFVFHVDIYILTIWQ